MKELEALERINNEWLRDGQRYGNMEHAKEDYETLRKALTPPSSEEVCRQLSEWVNDNVEEALSNVRYDGTGFYYYDENDYEEYIVQKTFDKCIAFGIHDLPLHLIEIIVKFYKGDMKSE